MLFHGLTHALTNRQPAGWRRASVLFANHSTVSPVKGSRVEGKRGGILLVADLRTAGRGKRGGSRGQ